MTQFPKLIIDGFELDVPETSRWTQEQGEGRPDVWRVFPGGPAAFALSMTPSEPDAVSAVEAAAGGVLAEYRLRPRYARVSRPMITSPSADVSAGFDFRWDDGNGVLMHSVALVASFGDRTVVVHGALPDIHGAEAFAEMEAVVLSCHPVTEEQT